MTKTPLLETMSILIAYSAAGVFWGAFAAAAPSFQAQSGLDTAGFGLLLASMTCGAVPAMVIFGRVADKAARWALPSCLLAFAVAALALSLTNSLTGLVLSFFLIGAASGALDIALNMRVSAIERLGFVRLFNRAHAMYPLALLVASPIVGLARNNGAQIGIIFASVAAILGAAALLEAIVSKDLVPQGLVSKSTASAQTDETPNSQPSSVVLGVLLLLGLIAALGSFQEMAVQSWSAIFMETVLGASATVGGIAPAAFMLGLSGGRFAVHLLEQRFEPMLLVVTAAAIGIPAFLLIAASSNWQLALVGFVLAGFAIGPIEPTIFRTVTQRAARGSRGKMLSVVTTIAYVGYLTSPPVLGTVAETAGWPALWILAATFALSVALLILFVRRKL